MNLNFETILDFYTHKNKKILCQIKVSPSKCRKFKNTCRSLTQEQWKTFDKELEKLIISTDDWNDQKCLKFNIKPYIEVKVQKSKLSLKHFHKCLGTIDDTDKDINGENVIEAKFVLECVFHFHEELPINSILESQEYKPQVENSPGDKLSSPLSYEPYTPSKKKCRSYRIDTVKTPGIDFLEYNEDTYSPKPIFKVSESKPKLTETVPNYKLAPIKSIHMPEKSHSRILNKVIIETEDEVGSPENVKPLGSNINMKSNKAETKFISKSQEFAVVDVSVNIDDTKQRKVPKFDEVKKPKKRFNTIDEFPSLLNEDSREKYNAKKEHLESKDKHSYCDKKFKNRSKSIDDIPASFAVNLKRSKLTDVLEEIEKKPVSTDKIAVNKSKEKGNDSIENIFSTKGKETPSEKKVGKLLNTLSSNNNEFFVAHTKPKKDFKTKSKASDDEFEGGSKVNKDIRTLPSNNSKSTLNISTSPATESKTDTSSQKVIKKSKETDTDGGKSLRRSERSPSKPKRLIEEHSTSLQRKKPKKLKTSHKNRELFGTDDDDDAYFENNNSAIISKDKELKSSIFETPISEKSSKSASSSSSTKKKHSRDKSSECEQEKRGMSKWLSKKKSSTSSEETAKSSKETSKSKYPPLKTTKKEKHQKADVETDNRNKSPTPTFELPSKEELELIRNKTKLMQKENAKVRAELDKMRTSPPKEVEFLSLQNVPVEDILNTFLSYKPELDEIYENNRKKDYIKSHDGINHCFVIRLLQPNIQMKMLEKLTEVYSNTNSSTQATLFANALLPEWVIRVFMEKYNFTRHQAINQIKEQEEFKLHMEEQSDNSFVFD